MAAIRYTLTLVLLFGLAAGTFAQLAPEEIPPDPNAEMAVDEIRYYSVEVIVFDYTDPTSAGNEIFDPEPVDQPGERDFPDAGSVAGEIAFGDASTGLPSAPGAQDELPGTGDLSIEELPSLTSVGFRRLTPDEMTMENIHEKLTRLDAYRPLFWGGWLQQAVDEELTVPVRLRMLGNAPLDLDGVLTLYSRNYLHLVVDLTLQQPVAPIEPTYRQQNRKFGGRPVASDNQDRDRFSVGEWQTIDYRIEEDRIFNSGHLRYFDHPKFGALVRINRVEMPDDGAGDVAPGLRPTDAE